MPERKLNKPHISAIFCIMYLSIESIVVFITSHLGIIYQARENNLNEPKVRLMAVIIYNYQSHDSIHYRFNFRA